MYPDQEKTNQEQVSEIRDSIREKLQSRSGLAGSAGVNCDPVRPGLQERVESGLHRASREARKLELLRELSFLLQKNPEVARILDLVEMVRG